MRKRKKKCKKDRSGSNPNVWPEMVVPSFPALFPNPSIQQPCDVRPFFEPEAFHQLDEHPINKTTSSNFTTIFFCVNNRTKTVTKFTNIIKDRS